MPNDKVNLSLLEKCESYKEDLDESFDDQHYKSHPLRYFVYLLFYFQLFFFGFFLCTYLTLTKQLKIAFGVELCTIQLSVSLALFGKLAIIPFSSFFIEKFGMRKINFVAVFFLFLASFLRCQIAYSYNFVHLAMLCNSIANIFLSTQFIKFCFNWFSPRERGIFISLLHTSIQLGAAIGQIYPQIIVGSEYQSAQDLQSQIKYLNHQYLIIYGALAGATLLLYREKPPRGYGWQNLAGSIRSSTHPNASKPFMFRIKNLLKHEKFRSYLSIYTLKQSFGITYSQIAILMMQENNYPYWTSGGSSILNAFFGAVGSVQYMKQFINKSQQKYLSFYTVIGFFLFNIQMIIFTLKYSYVEYLTVNQAFTFFSTPVMAVMFELITRNVLIDDFNFMNNILVFVSMLITAFAEIGLSLLYKLCADLMDSFYIVQVCLCFNILLILYFCFNLKQLHFIIYKIQLRQVNQKPQNDN